MMFQFVKNFFSLIKKTNKSLIKSDKRYILEANRSIAFTSAQVSDLSDPSKSSFIYVNFLYYRLSNYNANIIKKYRGEGKKGTFNLAKGRLIMRYITKT